MKRCSCHMCDCPNEVKEFGHRYEEEIAIAEAEFEHDPDKAEAIIAEICSLCEKGQHPGKPKE